MQAVHPGRTVHVVAWHHDDGAGFDWYFSSYMADSAYEDEIEMADQYAKQGWSAYRFDYTVESAQDGEELTREIDADLDDLCVQATRKHEHALPGYGRTLTENAALAAIA